MSCSSLLRALLPTICAASLIVPSRAYAEPPPETTPPVDEKPSEIGDASQDEMHEAMVRAFTERFQEGRFLYNRGQYTQAAAEFERAFAAIPAEAALRNAVLSYERANDRVSAALAARRYLELPSCDTPDIVPEMCSQHRDDIEQQLERLMGQVGELRLRVAKGVGLREISINNRKIAIADFPVLIAPGRIDVELVGTMPGQRRQRVVDVRAGEQSVIEVGPFDVPDPEPIGPGGRRRLERPKWLRPLFWSGLGLTIASGAAMATMGALTLRAQKRAGDQLCDTNPTSPLPDCPMDDGDHFPHGEARRLGEYRVATNALIGVTAGLAMITTVVALIAFTGQRDRNRNGGTRRASTRMRWTGAGVLVRW